MNLPAQLRERVAEAEKLREQAYGKPADKPESEANADNEADSGNTDEVVAQAAPVVTEVRVSEQPATAKVEDENSQTYAQRWRSLQGVHNALLQRVGGLEQLIGTMQSAPSHREESRHEQPPSKLITPKDDDDYGSDMVDFSRRVAREEMAPVIRMLSQMQHQMDQLGTLAPKVQQVATNQHASAEEKFFAQLENAVPDWAQVNDDRRFHEWLLTPDEMTGITRQTYLADARSNLDLRRTVSVFQTWKRETGVAPTVAQPTHVAQQTNASRLEKQIAPGRTNAATAAPSPKAERTWTPAEIAAFYADRRNGKFKGREAESSAMERDIFLAQRDGRIR